MVQQGVSVKRFFLSVLCETFNLVNVVSDTSGFFVFAVCNKMTKYRAISPFLCMDMTYITCLLKEGFGFKDSTVLQVSCDTVGDTKYEKLHDKTIIFCLYSVS